MSSRILKGLNFYEDFYNHSIRIQKSSKGFLYEFWMDFLCGISRESMGIQRISKGMLKEFL
jgi:hypothetical protein